MSDLIIRWIQHRLGILIDHHKTFGEATRDGLLLCILLKNYGIIEEDQLNLIEKTNVAVLDDEACYRNFNEYITRWLAKVGVFLSPDDVVDIVNGKESTTMAVFHKLFLKLHDKNSLDVLTHQRLHQKLRPESKFSVTSVKEPLNMTLERNKLAAPLDSAYDVVHWHRDRFEVLVSRDEDQDVEQEPQEVVPSLDQSYDMNKAREILKKLQTQRKQKLSNEMVKQNLHHDILNAFWEEIKSEDSEELNNQITEKVLKQSLYEKQIIRKMQDVKHQKDIMIKNKEVTNDAIGKEREQVFVNRLLDQNKDLNEKEILYYIDKERTINLHKKLYNERIRLREERTKQMCSDILNDLVTAAMVEREPFEEMFKPVEDIICGEDEDDEEIEEIIHREINSYQNLEWPWLLENIEIDEETLYNMECGGTVLGRIVFSLLEMKYPIPAFPASPGFEKLLICACVNGLSDTAFLPVLQKMLRHRQIIVVEMKDVIEYCLNAYKAEIRTGDEDPDQPEDEQTVKKKKGKGKGKKEKRSKKDVKGKKRRNKGDITPDEEVISVIEKIDKKVQTPRLYPNEEPILSQQAELGKTVDEVLTKGNPVNDYLLVAMFVEYLKSKLAEIKGFVLINYPTTYEQAALLEEALTGIPVPGISTQLKTSKSIVETILEFADLEEPVSDQPYDEFEEYRSSKLVKDPYKKPDVPFYDTGLTAYIRVAHAEDISADGEETAKSKLEQFYSDQGCNYSLYYETFDFYTVKHLAKLIIGDYSIPPRSSLELFGDTIKYINADLTDVNVKSTTQMVKKGDKKGRPKQKVVKEEAGTATGEDKKSDKKGKEKKKGKGKKGKGDGSPSHAVIVREDKFTQLPELPNDLSYALASLWENLEDVYMDDFQQLLFIKRLLLNAVMPFANYAKQYMTDIITAPDNKKDHLRRFQQIYNEFDDDIRVDLEFKAELHCRVQEMKDKLIDLCDQKMLHCEMERGNLINQRWAPRQLIELLNTYISAFQLELDRFLDTQMLIADYYTVGDFLGLALAYVSKMDKVAMEVYERTRELFNPQPIGGKVKKEKKSKESKKGGGNEKNMLKLFEPDEKVKRNFQKIFDEWVCTLRGETARVTVRLNLLRADFVRSVNEVLGTLRKTFHDIYEDIQKRGWLPVRSFTFILQDMTVNDQQRSVPKMWFNLSPENIDKLVTELFGRFEMVPWKEFVLYNLMVPFPTEDELKENFDKVDLWFEEKLEKLQLIKDLLYKLYRVDETWVNYTAMLLDFCKGKTTPEGIGKALTLSLGTKVCSDKEMGDEQATKMLLERAMYEEELARREEERFVNIEYMDTIVDQLVDQTVHLCESIIIDEVFDDETQVPKSEHNNFAKQVTLDDDVAHGTESASPLTKEAEAESLPKIPNQEIRKILSNRVSDAFRNRDEKGVQIKSEPDEYVEPKRRSDTSEEELPLNEDDVGRLSSENILEVQEMEDEPEVEIVISGVDVGKEINEKPFRYFMKVEELQDALKRVIPDYFKVRKINAEEQNLDEFVQEIFDQCKRPEFNEEAFVHDILNNESFLEHINMTCKFLIKNAPKLVEKYVKGYNKV
nr:unnamed protein product [Callosobruchus chinensis]